MSRKLMMWAALATLTAGFFIQQASAQEEAYTAMLQTKGTPGAGGSQVQFTVRITKWVTQDEIKQLGVLLKEKGQNALLNELKGRDAGRINKTGDTGNQIAIAEKWKNGDQTMITMISARRMTMFETKSRSQSTKYPFAFLQFTLNADGEGTGKLVESAAVKPDKEKETYKLDPFGQGARLVTNVKPVK